jgi:hypothetical protein
MLSYLEELSSKTINEFSTPEQVKDLLGGAAKAYEISDDFFPSFLIHVVRLATTNSEEFIYEELERKVNVLIKYKISYEKQQLLTITKIERNYLFDEGLLPTSAFGKLPHNLKHSVNEVFTLDINYLTISFIIDKRNLNFTQKETYVPELQRITLFPKFLMVMNENGNNIYVENNNSRNNATAALQYPLKELCPCLSSNQNYQDCCFSLFVNTSANKENPVYWGFHDIDTLEALEPHLAVDIQNTLLYKRIQKAVLTAKQDIGNTSISSTTIMKSIVENIPFPGVVHDKKQEPELIQKYLDSIYNAADTNFKNIVSIIKDSQGITVKAAFSEEAMRNQVRNLIDKQYYNYFIEEINNLMDYFIESNSRLRVSSLKEIILSWSILSLDIRIAIIDSLDLMLNDKAQSACYVLYPQLERMLRELNTKIFEPSLSLTKAVYDKPHQRTYLTLGALITEHLTATTTDDTNRRLLIKLFAALFTTNGQFYNLRNELLHGFEGKIYEKQEYYIGLYMIIAITTRFHRVMKEVE